MSDDGRDDGDGDGRDSDDVGELGSSSCACG
jgi:hypothetical protein